MTDRRTELLALADKVEREPASRELDGAIAIAVGWQRVDTANLGCPPDLPDAVHRIPLWTQSLDAAVGLLPSKGVAWWELNVEAAPPTGAGTRATIVWDAHNEKIEGWGRTPAAALVSACLRARAEMETTNGR